MVILIFIYLYLYLARRNLGLDEKLYLFIGNDNNQWTVNNEVSFTYDRDVVSFKMESIIKR